VVDCRGHTYDRCSIERALRTNPGVSPTTNQRYPGGEAKLVPNFTLKSMIERWTAQHGTQRPGTPPPCCIGAPPTSTQRAPTACLPGPNTNAERRRQVAPGSAGWPPPWESACASALLRRAALLAVSLRRTRQGDRLAG